MRIKVPDRIRRISKEFAETLDRIKLERVKLGKDKKLMSDARLTDGIIKDPEFDRIKFKLIRMPRKENLK